MKKLLSFPLALCLVSAFVFTSCSDDENDGNGGNFSNLSVEQRKQRVESVGVDLMNKINPADHEIAVKAINSLDILLNDANNIPEEDIQPSPFPQFNMKSLRAMTALNNLGGVVGLASGNMTIAEWAELDLGTYTYDSVKEEFDFVSGTDDKVKNAGVQFAIVRAGYRGSVTGSLVEDPQFVANMKGATAAGIPVGVYFFTQATDEKEAVEEASAVLELIRDFQLTYPVFIDTEGAGGNGRADGLNAETRTLVCEAFCRTVENAGYTAGVYASRNWYNNNLQTARLENYHIWLAEYRSVPLYQGYYKTWQYTSKGKVDGIEGRVDINITYE